MSISPAGIMIVFVVNRSFAIQVSAGVSTLSNSKLNHHLHQPYSLTIQRQLCHIILERLFYDAFSKIFKDVSMATHLLSFPSFVPILFFLFSELGFMKMLPNPIAEEPCRCIHGYQCYPVNCEYCEKIPNCPPGKGIETNLGEKA